MRKFFCSLFQNSVTYFNHNLPLFLSVYEYICMSYTIPLLLLQWHILYFWLVAN
jgi:hypothetical protein